jgi:FPC/CPF motif-containing protein YcgG
MGGGDEEMMYLWLKNGQPFAIVIFESPEGKKILINLDRFGSRFDFMGALAVKLHKKYPSQFPPLVDGLGNRHPFWSGGNYFEILHELLGNLHKVEGLDLPVYKL